MTSEQRHEKFLTAPPQEVADARLKAARDELRRALGMWVRTANPPPSDIGAVIGTIMRDCVDTARRARMEA